jgi:glucose 1-dehydrogenase
VTPALVVRTIGERRQCSLGLVGQWAAASADGHDAFIMEQVPRPVTIVTGGGRGIGAATALHLVRSGHNVVVNYRRDRSAAERVVEVAAGLGGRAVAVQADVTREDEVDGLFEAAQRELGPVTGLVNNAGATAHVGALADTPIEVVREVLEVNLLGVIMCARRGAQLMSTRRGGAGGAIVNVSSAAATLGSAYEYVHYAAAKAGVDALTVGLGKELAQDGIRVNAVAPGTVRTDIHAAAGDPDRADRVATQVPLGRAGEPHDIASAIVWLLSDEASYITGAILRVAGGL